MINKIHQNMRDSLYQLAQSKKFFLVDKSQNNILLVCSGTDNFSNVEKFIKKEFSYSCKDEWKTYSPMYKIKEIFVEKEKVRYKIRIGIVEHLCGHQMTSLMVSVNL